MLNVGFRAGIRHAAGWRNRQQAVTLQAVTLLLCMRVRMCASIPYPSASIRLAVASISVAPCSALLLFCCKRGLRFCLPNAVGCGGESRQNLMTVVWVGPMMTVHLGVAVGTQGQACRGAKPRGSHASAVLGF